MPRILIELSQNEYKVLLAAAKRDRRTAQAEAAQLLVDLLGQWTVTGVPINRATGGPFEVPEGDFPLPEADRAPLGAGGALPAQQDVGAEQGHGDGPAAGVNEVVVGGPGEAE